VVSVASTVRGAVTAGSFAVTKIVQIRLRRAAGAYDTELRGRLAVTKDVQINLYGTVCA